MIPPGLHPANFGTRIARLEDDLLLLRLFCFLVFFIISNEYILFSAFLEFKDNFDMLFVDVRLSSLNEPV